MELNESTKLAKARENIIQKAKQHALFKNVEKTKGHIVFGRGEDSAKIIFMGEAPGFSENEKGKPFVGRSGALLELWVKHIGLGEKDYAVINSVPIIPLDEEGKIRPPAPEEINYFFDATKKIIDEINPEILVLLGKSAARAFNLEDMRVGEVREHIGKKFMFIYHPAYYLRNGKKGLEDAEKIKTAIEKHAGQKKQLNLRNF